MSGVENEGFDKDIGGIWMIKSVCQAVKTNEGKLKVENKYQALDDEENDDSSDDDEILEAAEGEDALMEVANAKMTKANL